MKRIKILIVSVLCILAAGCLLVGCKGKSANNKVGTKVVYCLEGGSFMNSTSDIVVYYQFPNDNLRKIPYKETTNYETVPKLDSKQAGEFEKSGCYIEGWYRVKNEDGTYEGKWDFDDPVPTKEELSETNGEFRLYAKWDKNIIYTYDLGYLENDEFKSVKTVRVKWGLTFKYNRESILKAADNYEGHTPTGNFTDLDGNPFDENHKFEKAKTDQTVRVVVDYIEGVYKIINTREDIESSNGEYEGRALYLVNDIDFGTVDGEEITKADFNFYSLFTVNAEGKPKYTGIVGANGEVKKIKNFKMTIDQYAIDVITKDPSNEKLMTFQGGIFGKDIKGLTFKDVSIEGVSVTLDLGVNNDKDGSIVGAYFAPVAYSISECSFENVSVAIDEYVFKYGRNSTVRNNYNESLDGSVWKASFDEVSVSGVILSVAERQTVRQ